MQALEEHTYETDQPDQVAEVLSFLDAHESSRGKKPEVRYLLVGAKEGDQVEIPEAVHRALRQIVEALQAGKAVTIAPRSKMLTTQQTADLLGVSRPTVVKLITDGVLPAETPGKRRRYVKLADLLDYREVRREQQYRALMETSVDYDQPEDDPSEREERLRNVRARLALERRQQNRTV